MMKIDDALVGVTLLGIDTSPFIYFVERHPNYVDRVREIIRRIDGGIIRGVSSVVTLTEVLTHPKRQGQTQIETNYRDLLCHGRNFSLLPIDVATADQAADLRARYNLRTPDALQLAAALSVGSQAFLTNDTALQRVTELQVLVLDDLEL